MTSKRKPSPTKLAIAVEGEGLAPKDIPLRYLTELLEAAAATFEALAAEKQIDPPRMSLAKVTSGSARYEFVSEDRQAARVAGAFWTAVKHRGKGTSQRTRRQLGRLYRAATRTGGALRVDPIDSKRTAKPIYLAAPIEEDRARIEEATVVFARVVGINIDSHENASVTLRYDDGGSAHTDRTSGLGVDRLATSGCHLGFRCAHSLLRQGSQGALHAADAAGGRCASTLDGRAIGRRSRPTVSDDPRNDDEP